MKMLAVFILWFGPRTMEVSGPEAPKMQLSVKSVTVRSLIVSTVGLHPFPYRENRGGKNRHAAEVKRLSTGKQPLVTGIQ